MARPSRIAGAIIGRGRDLGRRLGGGPWLSPALATAWLAALVPIWWPRFLPLFDFPAHLVHIAIWHRLPDPSWHYQDFYEKSLHVVPYWGYWFVVHLLSYAVPLEVANKLYLSLYAAALPASLIVLGRRFGRSPWTALFAFPLVFNFAFSHGFIGYAMALALAHVTLAQADACLERLTPLRLGGLGALALATYFTHFLPWLLMGLCFALLLAARRPPLMRALPVAGLLLATAVMAAINYHYAAAANLYGIIGAPTADQGFQFRAERPRDAIGQIPVRLIMGWPGHTGSVALAVLLACALVLVVTTRRRTSGLRRQSPHQLPHQLRDHLPALWALIAISGYLIVPFYLFWPVHWWNAGGRLITPAALFAVLAIRGPIEGRHRLVFIPVLVVCVLYPLELGRRFVSFNTRLDGLVRLMETVPRGASTLTLALGDPADPALDPSLTPYRAVHSYPQLLAGGFDPYQYKNGFPFRSRQGGAPRSLPAPPWLSPGELTPDMAARYDFVLTRNESSAGEIFGAVGSRVPLVGEDGAWRLYATRGLDLEQP